MNSPKTAAGSAWSPFSIPVFRIIWIAALASNIGTGMHEVGAGWLMATLSPTPVMVALVQTATSLPIFLLALPAGALADIIDRRRYLIATQAWLAAVATLLGVLTVTGVTTAWTLIVLTFAMGIGRAMMLPAWVSLTPELVPRAELQSAIALNSLGINVARSIGPALAGFIVSLAGSWAVFVLNAISYIGVIIVLARWRRAPRAAEHPKEQFVAALLAGFRFARHAPGLHGPVVRGLGFFLFASASWALLPLIAKGLVNGGPEAYGILLASIGLGAVSGAVVLPALRKKLSRDVLVAGASILYAAALLALANLERLWPLSLAMVASGMAWITVLSSLQTAAQLALPDWVRSRGLAVYVTVFMGSMALGSLVWGKVAELYGIPQSLMIAATGQALAVLLTWRWRLTGFDHVEAGT